MQLQEITALKHAISQGCRLGITSGASVIEIREIVLEKTCIECELSDGQTVDLQSLERDQVVFVSGRVKTGMNKEDG